MFSYTVLVVLCSCLCLQLVSCQFGFFPHHNRENRRYGSQFEFGQNLLSGQRRITDRLTGILHLRPEIPNSNPNYVYPFNNRPGIINDRPYDQYRPNYPQNNGYDQYYPTYDAAHDYVNFESPSETTSNQENPSNSSPASNYQPGSESQGGSPNNLGQGYQDNSKETSNDATVTVPGGQRDESKFGDKNSDGFNNEAITFSPLTPVSTALPELTPVPSALPELKPVPSALPELTPVPYTQTETTKLQELTPVPIQDSRDSFGFAEGIFRDICQAADGKQGSCISIVQCEPYFRLLKEIQTNPAAGQFLRRAHCGFEGNNPKVCCPHANIPVARPTTPPTTTTITITTTTTEKPNVPSGKTIDPEDFVPALPDPPVCGLSNASFSRVVGGVDAKLGDFPWMALLGYKKSYGVRWLCGGSLITSKHILTAAHCIHGREEELYVIRVGELDLAREDDGATPVDVLIKAKIKHEQYDSKAFTNDIGILVLDKELQFTDLIKPICIPKERELRGKSFENYNPMIAGWGNIEYRGPAATHLQALQLPVVSNEFCAQVYSQYKAQVIDRRVLCAGYKKGGKDACQGDSGGPLMQPIWNQVDSTTHFYQIGVVSFGKKCAEAGFPGVYSRVTEFVPWIQEKVLGFAAD